MINIGICDDDVAMTAIIEEMLHKIANEQDIKINCAVFSTASLLWKISGKELIMI